MSDKRDVTYDDRPVGTAEERRRWKRCPSAHDAVMVTSGSVQQTAVVLNVSAFGMGHAIDGSTGLAERQVVTIEGLSGPVQAVIRHTTTDDKGASFLGVEWCE